MESSERIIDGLIIVGLKVGAGWGVPRAEEGMEVEAGPPAAGVRRFRYGAVEQGYQAEGLIR